MVRHILNKIKHIIIGNWRTLTGYKSDEQKRRLDICKTCRHNIKFGGARICSLCGCILKSKAAIKEEKCYINKW